MDQLRLDVLNEFTTTEITEQEIDLQTHIPSFDEFVRHIFRPAWKYCRISTELEITITFAAVIVDTLHTVNDQIERRTYGHDHMKKTISCWENLIRQLRIVLILKSRMYWDKVPSFYTVHALTIGDLSLYHMLAYDTLEFTLTVEQSQEHEERCREVVKKRLNAAASSNSNQNHPTSLLSASLTGGDKSRSREGRSGSGGTDNDMINNLRSGGGGAGTVSAEDAHAKAAARSEVLIAWGSLADKRWRDLLNVAITEDQMEEEEEKINAALDPTFGGGKRNIF
jgi:hypothetical protein